jgi:hypothetical protein
MKTIHPAGLAAILAIGFAACSQAQIIYQDGFGYTAASITGSAPDTVDASGDTWTGYGSTNGTHGVTATSVVVNSGSASVVAGFNGSYTNADIAVNDGKTGDTLNGAVDFSLTATVTPSTPDDTSVAIFLSTAAITNNTWANATYYLGMDAAGGGGYDRYTGSNYDYYNATTKPGAGDAGLVPLQLEMYYSASAATITYYSINPATQTTTTLGTQTGVTPANVAAIRDVGFAFRLQGSNTITNETAGVDSFNLQTIAAVPEPGTFSYAALGFLGLVGLQARRWRRSGY